MIKDQNIIEIFKITDQLEKVVHLVNDRILIVWNITWGYDLGDEFAHITTNISPKVKNSTIDFFYTNEIEKIEDRTNGKILYNKEKNGP